MRTVVEAWREQDAPVEAERGIAKASQLTRQRPAHSASERDDVILRPPSKGGHAGMRSGRVGRRSSICASAALSVALLCSGFAERAAAHALLVEAIPAEAATLATSPPQLVLRFNSRIEHKLSRAALIAGENGAPQPLVVDAATTPDRLVATLPALAPGSYVVDWQVLSVDGHRVAGKLRFQIRGPG